MKFVLPRVLTFLFVGVPLCASAQLDSSYELLLGVPVPTQTTPVKAQTPTKRRRIASEPMVQSGKMQPAPGEVEKNAAAATSAPPSQLVIVAEPSISDQAQSLFAANPEKVLNYYEEKFDPQDPRQNKVEITFAPTFVTDESASNYSFRNYRSVFSAISVGANVWLTPAIGIGGNFLFSLAGDTSGDAATGTPSPARHELFDVGLKFRQFFGFETNSKSVEFDVLFSDYKFNVPSDDLYRARLKTSGLGVKAILRLPTSADFAWIIGGSFYPRMQHSETGAGANIKSGDSSENTRLGVQLGSELKLAKGSQIFWEASASSEKNLFGGSASLVDPATGQIPKNSSVTNTFYQWSFGYRWGN